jgi:glycosyltransferase involved in cell wall biosynthesis
MKISIGILAYNEAASIEPTLQSLFQQSLLDDGNSQNSIEIVVVPNGCSDNTADVSHTILTRLTQNCPHPNLRFSVCEVTQAGKSNAWNQYVHKFADPTAAYLILMDADIQLLEIDTLYNTIEALEQNPTAHIAVDTPVKDIVLKPNKSPIERLSVAVSSSAMNNYDVWICGQLYCGRAEVLRKIWMPQGITLEDGFLTTIVRTSNFTASPMLERIVRAPNASHTFEALTDPQRLLRHEKCIVIGMTVKHYLLEYIEKNCNEQVIDAGTLIERMNQRDPQWLSHLFQNVLSKKGWWIIPHEWLFRRFDNMKSKPWHQIVRDFPIAVMALFVDSIVFFTANREMRKGNSIGYW